MANLDARKCVRKIKFLAILKSASLDFLQFVGVNGSDVGVFCGTYSVANLWNTLGCL